jgi:hypothetical protein
MRSVPPYKRGGQLSISGAIWAIFTDDFSILNCPFNWSVDCSFLHRRAIIVLRVSWSRVVRGDRPSDWTYRSRNRQEIKVVAMSS